MKKLSMVGFAMERGVTMTDEQLVYAVVEGRGQMQGREDSVMVAALPLALPGSELQQPLEIRTSSQQELTTAIVRLGGSLLYPNYLGRDHHLVEAIAATSATEGLADSPISPIHTITARNTTISATHR